MGITLTTSLGRLGSVCRPLTTRKVSLEALVQRIYKSRGSVRMECFVAQLGAAKGYPFSMDT